MPLPESRREIEELLAEAKYYLVQGLLEECQAALQVGTPSFCLPTWGTPDLSATFLSSLQMGSASLRHWEAFCTVSLGPADAELCLLPKSLNMALREPFPRR